MNNTIKNRIFLFSLVLLFILPFLFMLIGSVSEVVLLSRGEIKFTKSNFEKLFFETSFVQYFINSLLIGIFTVILTLTFSIPTAYIITRFKIACKDLILFFSLVSYMIAPIILALPLFLVFEKIGIINTTFSLILAHFAFCFPFSLWMLRSFLKSLPFTLEYSAMIDGVNFRNILFKIILPAIKPGILAVTFFTFILSWNEYVFARIFISTDLLKTLPVGIDDMLNATVVDWGTLMSAGTLVSIPIFIITMLLLKHLNLKLY